LLFSVISSYLKFVQLDTTKSITLITQPFQISLSVEEQTVPVSTLE